MLASFLEHFGSPAEEQAGEERKKDCRRIRAGRAERIIMERSEIGRVRCLEHKQQRKPMDLAMRLSWMTLNGEILVEKRARLPRVQGGWVEGGSNIVQIRRERAGYSWKVRARL